jgi:KDO2-lipid IV(A) lauroyltransferase
VRRRSAARNWIEYAAAFAVVKSLEWLPHGLANALAHFYSGLLDRCMPRLRRVALRNLSMALPEASPSERRAIVDEVFRSIGRLLFSVARFPRITAANVQDWIRYQGFEHYEAALRRGKGVLFATAHFGNWELSAYAHALLSQPMHIVVRPLDNPLIDSLVERRRTLSGNCLILKKDFARGILKALSANEAVGILIDQNSTPDSGVFIDFFGMPACATAGFARLAAHSGASVIPGYALWNHAECRYILKFYPAVEITGDVAADTARLHKHLESAIREHPGQWLWIHRRWKTRPPGEPPLYE